MDVQYLHNGVFPQFKNINKISLKTANVTDFMRQAKKQCPLVISGKFFIRTWKIIRLQILNQLRSPLFILHFIPTRKEIYFVGLDTSSGHFFDKSGSYEVNSMMEGYHLLENFAQLYYSDVDVISVNPVGLKGLFTDVYTKSYVDEHPELLKETVKIIESENSNAE